ncbi:hypothetical protein A2U01_0097847, partial [Trifolium medium]|nr:hypothetical protein [Trifolium medium]
MEELHRERRQKSRQPRERAGGLMVMAVVIGNRPVLMV